MSSAAAPNGREWTIRHGEQEAVVVEVGGGLRTYEVAGRAVVWGYGAGDVCPAFRGRALLPWPNRVGDGLYEFDGRERQLALTEPERLNATQGLACWLPWRGLHVGDDAVTLALTLHPQQGWEWTLEVDVTYRLGAEGLTVTPHVRNASTTTAPFGYGAHPYLTAGERRVDDLALTVPASRRLVVDERLLPLSEGALVDVAGEDDLRRGDLLGERDLDAAYTDLQADGGRWRVVLEHPGTRRRTTLWADAVAYRWVQVFTGGALPPAARRVTGIAVEPMTCPPDALRSGVDLVRLEPGQEWSAPWGIDPGDR